MFLRKIRETQVSEAGEIWSLRAKKILMKSLPRKTSKVRCIESVPQTNTGGRVEKTKANE